jgi:hypothetical protein
MDLSITTLQYNIDMVLDTYLHTQWPSANLHERGNSQTHGLPDSTATKDTPKLKARKFSEEPILTPRRLDSQRHSMLKETIARNIDVRLLPLGSEH